MGLNSQNTPEEHHQNIFLYKVQFCPCETTENSPKLKLQKPTPTTKGLIFWCYRKMFMSRFSKIYVKINIKFSSSPISCKVNLYISPVFVCTSDYMYRVYILYFTSYEMTPSFHKKSFPPGYAFPGGIPELFLCMTMNGLDKQIPNMDQAWVLGLIPVHHIPMVGWYLHSILLF